MSTIVQFPKRPTSVQMFTVGDTFATQDGVRVHIMQERQTAEGRQFLYCAHGTKAWAADTRFVRAS